MRSVHPPHHLSVDPQYRSFHRGWFGAVLRSFKVYSLILTGPPIRADRFVDMENYDYHI